MDAVLLFQFTLSSIILTLSPGPDIIYVLTQSISNGKRYGIITAFGLVSGIIVHTSLVYFGIALLIQQNPVLFDGLKYLGAGYLFYLAFQVYRSNPEQTVNMQKQKGVKSDWALYLKGFVMNVINPKVSLFFLAFLPGFIKPELGNVGVQIFRLGAIFMVQAFLIFSMVSLLADKSTIFLRENQRFQPTMRILQIIVFIGLGIFLIL